ncbi:MAG TPA: hypothetical protein VEK79_01365 [Thermoanaerobaculia bacterium]|nr:hypothetical protein [Thermoanaerobaculia bacterium]
MKNIVRLVLVLGLWALPAAAQNNWDWSAAGSTGVVDHGTTSFYEFSGSYFGVRSDAIATVEARYPVTNTMGSATDISPAWTTFQIAVHDQYTSGGSVTATLYEVDKCSSTETQLCQIVSSDTDQDVHCDSCTFNGGLDFANNAYYVCVSVSKTATTADPRLYELAIY